MSSPTLSLEIQNGKYKTRPWKNNAKIKGEGDDTFDSMAL